MQNAYSSSVLTTLYYIILRDFSTVPELFLFSITKATYDI